MPRVNRRKVGKRYENQALSYLTQAGLILVDQNVYYPVGELDLIMKHGTTLVFIEVRFRRYATFGGAVISVTPLKRQRLFSAANHWLMARNCAIDNTDCRFDIFAITGKQIEWIQNAFNEDNFYD